MLSSLLMPWPDSPVSCDLAPGKAQGYVPGDSCARCPAVWTASVVTGPGPRS